MKLYLDMDGVIADFFGKVEQNYNVAHWKDLEDPSKTIESFKNTNWFYTLNPFLTSADLVAACRRIAGREYSICSSPIGGDEYNSGYWKREWLKQWGFLPEIHNLIFTGNKHRYATHRISGEPNVLVDDKPDNIQRWINAGGVGIRYQANKDSLEQLIANIEDSYRATS